LLGRFLPAQEAQPQPLRKPEKAAKGKTPAIAPCGDAASVIVASSQDEDAEIDAFFARRLETVQNEFIGATALYRAWACAEHGIDVGSQKAFNHRIRRRVGYDRNNGRPRYCHIRLKPKEHAPLRLAISNA
jgi:hypothetical protein